MDEGDASAVVCRDPLDPADSRRRGEVLEYAADAFSDAAADLQLLILGQILHCSFEPEK